MSQVEVLSTIDSHAATHFLRAPTSTMAKNNFFRLFLINYCAVIERYFFLGHGAKM